MIFKTNISFPFRLHSHWIRLLEIKTGYDPYLDARGKTYRLKIQQLLHVRLVAFFLFLFFQNNPKHLLNTVPKAELMKLTPTSDIANSSEF